MTSPETKTWSPRSTSSFHACSDSSPTDGERHHRLDAAAVARLQRREAELAGVAAEDDAPGDGGRHAGLGAGLEVGEALAQLGDRVGDRQRSPDRRRPRHPLARRSAARAWRGARPSARRSSSVGSVGSDGRRVGHRAGLLAKSAPSLSAASRRPLLRCRRPARAARRQSQLDRLAERQPADAIAHRRRAPRRTRAPRPPPAARSGSTPRRAPGRRPPATTRPMSSTAAAASIV